MKNNASRSKFLFCFRPEVDMEMDSSKYVILKRPPRRARLESNKVEELKEEEVKVKPPPLTKTMSLDRECSLISSQSTKVIRSRHNRTLSRVFKAVVFETILARKVREGRAIRHQDSFDRGKSQSLGTDELMMTTESEINTSHHQVVNSSSKQSTKKQEDSISKTKKNEKGSSSDLNLGMCLLVISLGITVFWGRVFAILFTSICLYLFSWRCVTKSHRLPESVRNLSEAEFRDQKRRVIMEGLIERNHHFHNSKNERGQ